jgi:hypothetical protein
MGKRRRFRDEGSPVYAAEGRSPEETDREIVCCVDGVLRDAIAAHQAGELTLLSIRMSTVKIPDFDTTNSVDHVVSGDELVPLSGSAIHALSLNAEALAFHGMCTAAAHAEAAAA